MSRQFPPLPSREHLSTNPPGFAAIQYAINALLSTGVSQETRELLNAFEDFIDQEYRNRLIQPTIDLARRIGGLVENEVGVGSASRAGNSGQAGGDQGQGEGQGVPAEEVFREMSWAEHMARGELED